MTIFMSVILNLFRSCAVGKAGTVTVLAAPSAISPDPRSLFLDERFPIAPRGAIPQGQPVSLDHKNHVIGRLRAYVPGSVNGARSGRLPVASVPIGLFTDASGSKLLSPKVMWPSSQTDSERMR